MEVGTVGETSQGIFEGRKEGREGGRGKKESKVRLQARGRLAGGTKTVAVVRSGFQIKTSTILSFECL